MLGQFVQTMEKVLQVEGRKLPVLFFVAADQVRRWQPSCVTGRVRFGARVSCGCCAFGGVRSLVLDGYRPFA
jgi:hypothetical protein